MNNHQILIEFAYWELRCLPKILKFLLGLFRSFSIFKYLKSYLNIFIILHSKQLFDII